MTTMPNLIPQLGIVYCEATFSAPTPLVRAGALATFIRPIVMPGLYAILSPDANWRPQAYRLLYVGQSESIYERVGPQHHKFDEWFRAASGPVYKAFYGMILSTEQERCAPETNIIESYNPPLNQARNSLVAAVFRAPAHRK